MERKLQTEEAALVLLKDFAEYVRDLDLRGAKTDDLDEIFMQSDQLTSTFNQEKLEEFRLIDTTIINGKGISFTAWWWTKAARKLAVKHGIQLPDDSFDQRGIKAEWET